MGDPNYVANLAGTDLLPNAEEPSFFWRSASFQTILTVASLSRFFLFVLNRTEVHGLPRFLDLLKSRADYKTRRRGLVTVSNHISVIDDPLIWGVLPLSFIAFHGYMNQRWILGSHDICFSRGWLRHHFFTLGQTLPTHRLAYSRFGGLFQPTMTEFVRMHSLISTQKLSFIPYHSPRRPSWPYDPVDTFSDLPISPSYPSSPTSPYVYLAPSRYACNSYSWTHIFPEGKTHQTPHNAYTMRYFKWGVSRLILEPPECPDLVAIFITGTDQVMHGSRTFPRFIPRIGKTITVTFGPEVDVGAVFGDLRRRWAELAAEHARAHGGAGLDTESKLGVLPKELEMAPEAVELRIECTRRVREEVLKVRRSMGFADEDPKCGLVETWMKEGEKREGRMDDGSWVSDV